MIRVDLPNSALEIWSQQRKETNSLLGDGNQELVELTINSSGLLRVMEKHITYKRNRQNNVNITIIVNKWQQCSLRNIDQKKSPILLVMKM
jgi:hypothetical protein